MLATNYTIDDIFNIYHNMVYFGGHAISDIDDMQPSERDIFFYMLKKTVEEKNKRRKASLPKGFKEV